MPALTIVNHWRLINQHNWPLILLRLLILIFLKHFLNRIIKICYNIFLNKPVPVLYNNYYYVQWNIKPIKREEIILLWPWYNRHNDRVWLKSKIEAMEKCVLVWTIFTTIFSITSFLLQSILGYFKWSSQLQTYVPTSLC